MSLILKYKSKNITEVPTTPGTNYVALSLLQFSNGNMAKAPRAVAPDTVITGTDYGTIGTGTYFVETVPTPAVGD